MGRRTETPSAGRTGHARFAGEGVYQLADCHVEGGLARTDRHDRGRLGEKEKGKARGISVGTEGVALCGGEADIWRTDWGRVSKLDERKNRRGEGLGQKGTWNPHGAVTRRIGPK